MNSHQFIPDYQYSWTKYAFLMDRIGLLVAINFKIQARDQALSKELKSEYKTFNIYLRSVLKSHKMDSSPLEFDPFLQYYCWSRTVITIHLPPREKVRVIRRNIRSVHFERIFEYSVQSLSLIGSAA